MGAAERASRARAEATGARGPGRRLEGTEAGFISDASPLWWCLWCGRATREVPEAAGAATITCPCGNKARYGAKEE